MGAEAVSAADLDMEGFARLVAAGCPSSWQARIVRLSPGDRNRFTACCREQRIVQIDTIERQLADLALCGEIVLADFDRLDLSNLNRLPAGVDELGLRKTTIVARRIARIDPYLTVTVFEDGVTSSNLGTFLAGLDLLIEECDGLPIKHEVRLHARALRMNVVYAADERGFLSVEPYAHWPTLRPFHGLIETPPLSRERYPTSIAFMKALTEWMGGWSNISERSQRSLACVGETLCGYPQLASEARYAAGQIGHVARRLLLSERLHPFVGNLDLAQYLPAEDAC